MEILVFQAQPILRHALFVEQVQGCSSTNLDGEHAPMHRPRRPALVHTHGPGPNAGSIAFDNPLLR